MRQALSDVLVELGKKDPKVLLLTGDHGYALFDDFRRECPNQYINVGIAEQNMVEMLVGLDLGEQHQAETEHAGEHDAHHRVFLHAAVLLEIAGQQRAGEPCSEGPDRQW